MRGKPRPASQTARTERIIPARAGQTSMTATMLPPSPDHPRACGANEQEAVEQADQLGSSPRVRGKRYWKGRPSRHRRIIPARAGQTVTGVSIRSPPPDHPRACGANCTRTVSHASRTGSSPRVRGKLPTFAYRAFHRRIIPARAGQTSRTQGHRRSAPDHPRACGANSIRGSKVQLPAGSSPRVRGKPATGRGQFEPHRIIPARAGQTSRSNGRLWRASDHPRACGANAALIMKTAYRGGSSPRVRGKLVVDELLVVRVRIIPARAGQTDGHGIEPWSRSDHPRACGANSLASFLLLSFDGSSPRVRGKPLADRQRPQRERIIPARAGQTPDPDAWSWLRPDHPRACGANVDHLACVPFPAGSSPRVRGKHSICARPVSRTRIIPARAGQTSCCRRNRRRCSDHPRACGANGRIVRRPRPVCVLSNFCGPFRRFF